MDFIDLKAQRKKIEKTLQTRMDRVFDHGGFIMGPEVAELESQLARYVGIPHAIAVANGTDALQLAMMALGVGPGDEVITTSFSFIATAETIVLLGATPVFVDIHPGSYLIHFDRVLEAITSKTKAIIPVSLYGQMPDLERLESLVRSRAGPGQTITIIEDAAQSFGATKNGRKSGSISAVSCTSFFPSKPLGCYGDGGALFTADESLAQKLRQIRVHGQSRRYHHPVIGVNSRLDTLQAAVLLAKLEIFDEEVSSRQRLAEAYDSLLKSYVGVPTLETDATSVYAQYTIRTASRDALAEYLKSKNIPTAIHYPLPLHLQPALSSWSQGAGSLPHSELAAKQVLSLPFHPYLSDDDQQTIARAIRDFFQSKTSRPSTEREAFVG